MTNKPTKPSFPSPTGIGYLPLLYRIYSIYGGYIDRPTDRPTGERVDVDVMATVENGCPVTRPHKSPTRNSSILWLWLWLRGKLIGLHFLRFPPGSTGICVMALQTHGRKNGQTGRRTRCEDISVHINSERPLA